MDKVQKQETVETVASLIGEAQSVIAVDYRGIDVPQINELRAKLREADSTFRIVKNSLTELAADKAGEPQLKSLIEGPTAFTFVRGDAMMAAKALNKFVRDEKVIQFRGGFVDGSEVTADDLARLAKLPAMDQLQAQLVGAVSSPLTILVRGLNSMIGGLATALADLQKKRESEEPAVEEPKSEKAKPEEREEKESEESEEPEGTEDKEPEKGDPPAPDDEADQQQEPDQGSDETSETEEA